MRFTVKLVIALAVLISAREASALSKCAAKLSKDAPAQLGVSASTVATNLRWGTAAGEETHAFDNQATCIAHGAAKNCLLGPDGSRVASTVPSGCVVYLRDDAGSCTAALKGCTTRPPVAVATDGTGAIIGPVSGDVTTGLTALVSDASGHAYPIGVIQDVAEVPNGSALTGDSTTLYFENFDCASPPLVLNQPATSGRRFSTVINDGAGTYTVLLPAGPPMTHSIGARTVAAGGTGCATFGSPPVLSVSVPGDPITFVRPFRVTVD